MNFWAQFLTIATVHLLAVMSPGPDFILVTKNSLVYNKKAGILTALGLGFGILVHVVYSLLGIGLIISKSVVLFSIIKFIGAGYLFYIGYKSLTSKPSHNTIDNNTENNKQFNNVDLVKSGFITNVTNPKVTLFFLALFTQVIDPKTPLSYQAIYGLEMSFVTFLWFAFVATALSFDRIKKNFTKIQHVVEKLMGGILIAFGIKLALTTK